LNQTTPSEIDLAKCTTCGALHVSKIKVKKRYGKQDWTRERPVCSIECALEHKFAGAESFTIVGASLDEVQRAINQKNAIDVQWQERGEKERKEQKDKRKENGEVD